MNDRQIREALAKAWKVLGVEACCGGMGLVVGCPTCGLVWGKHKLSQI